MTKLHNLKSNKGARYKAKRIGRGNSSGAGAYSGRGMNGQNSRTGGGVKPGFEGGQTPLIRKMPKLKGFKNVNRVEYQVVNVGNLSIFDENEEIDIVKLYEKKLISSKVRPVKLLGDGEVVKKLIVKVDLTSASAREKIEKAKGKVMVMREPAPAASVETAKTE